MDNTLREIVSENILTLDQKAMNDQVKVKYPDLYMGSWRASHMSFLSGALIVIGPVAGFQFGVLGDDEAEFLRFAIVGAIVGFLIAVIISLVYFSRLKDEKICRVELVKAVETMFPDAKVYFGSESLEFRVRVQSEK